MKKLSFLLLAFGLFLGSCSKQSYVSCPSFKDGHKSLAWNNYNSSPKKKKSKNSASHLVKKSQSDWAIEKEVFSVEPIAARQNIEPLYASIEPSVLYTPNLNLLNEKPVAPVSHKAAKKPIRESRIAGKTQSDQQQVLTQAKKETEKSPAEAPSGGKSQLIALLLCFFLGGLGIHRFYLGYTTIGIIQLLTAGGCGIWALIDLIRIITGDLKPKDGDYSEKL